MSSRPLRLAVIGCGNVLDAYAPACDQLHKRGLAQLIMACGRPHQRDRAAALGIPQFTAKEEDVIGSGEVDAVLILTSTNEHARLAAAALKAGKHVLVEKPLATNLADAAQLLALARQQDRYLCCAPFTVLSPTFQTIGRRVQRGDIGQVCSARGRYGWAGPWWSDWFYRPGGGALFDLGVYPITSLTGLLGPVKRVMAMTGVAIPERELDGRRLRVEADDNAQVLLDFGDACFGAVTSGFTMQQYRSPALELYGTTGTLQMLGDDWDPDGYELWGNDAGAWQLYKETDPNWAWTDGLRHWVECICGATRMLVTPEHAFHVLEIMIKAQQSSRENRAVLIESTFDRPSFEAADAAEAAHLIHDRTRQH